MNEHLPGSPVALILQLLCLLTGIVLIYIHKNFSDPTVALLSGLFFINIFWVTIVLAYDLAIWGWIRNSVTGNLLLLSVIVINLIAVFIRAVYINFFK